MSRFRLLIQSTLQFNNYSYVYICRENIEDENRNYLIFLKKFLHNSYRSLSKILYFAESKVSLSVSRGSRPSIADHRPRDVLITHRERPRATLRSILCKSSSESTSFTRSEKGVRRVVYIRRHVPSPPLLPRIPPPAPSTLHAAPRFSPFLSRFRVHTGAD